MNRGKMLRTTSYASTSDTLKKAEKRFVSPFHIGASNFSKRAFDIIMALMGLIVVSPFWAIIAILIKRDSPGPVFYRGPRVGKDGKIFDILKFRTMYECPESYSGPRVTSKEDNRITPLGQWLRDTKINELPQLWNVLVGEMSFVGPRPEDPEFVEAWPEDARREILSVRPGITGPASILYHDEEQMLAVADVVRKYINVILPDKLRLYQLYVRNHSFFSDIDFIFWTFAIFLPRVEVSRLREGYLFAGPLKRLTSRHLSWFVLDLLVSLCAVTAVSILWRSHEPLNWGISNLFWLSILLAFLFSGINLIAGMNRIAWAEAFAEDAAGLVVSSGSATILLIALNYLQFTYQWLPYPSLPTTMIFTIGLMASVGFVAIRYRWRLLTGFASLWLHLRQRATRVIERVLIVGSGEGTDYASWILKRGEISSLLSIVGIVDDEQPAMHGMRVKGNLLLGGVNDLPTLIKKHDVGVILLAIPKVSPDKKANITSICNHHDVRLIMLSDLLSILQQQLTAPSQ